MKSLVTGGTGFIGSHLVNRLLKLNHEVVVVDNFCRGNKLDKKTIEGIQLIEGDVRDLKTIIDASKKCERIFHLAAVLGVDIVADNQVLTMDTEVLGLKNVCNAAVVNGVEKIVYASTSGIYGKTAIEKAVDEEYVVSPSSSYSIAKRYNEFYLSSMFKEKNVQSISLRFFNVYGPKQDNRMVIPRFFEQAKKSDPVTVYGSGNQTRDFTYIEDVIGAIVEVSEQVKGCQIINISGDNEHTIKNVAEKIVKLCGSNSEILFLNPPKERYDFEVERRYGSSAKLKNLTGYVLSTPFDVGLSNMHEYIISH